MGIQINGNTNNINAGIGSLSIEDIRELDITGVATASNFKTGISNLHDVGLTLTGGQIDVGSNIKIGTAGVITATSFVGSGANLTGISGVTINNYASTRIVTATNNANELDAETNLTVNGSLITFADSTLVINKGTNPTVTVTETAGSKSGQFRANTDGALLRSLGNYPLIFHTNQTERAQIDGSGRFLIGTNSVYNANSYSNNLIIYENGDAGASIIGNNSNSNYSSLYLSDTSTASRAFLEAQLGANGNFTIGTNGSGPIRFTNSGGEKLRITSDGKLGVGIASPVSILHLHESGSSGAPIIQFSNGDTGTTTGDGFAIGLADNESPFIYNRENTALRIATNNIERMRINSDGTVYFSENIASQSPTGQFGFRMDRGGGNGTRLHVENLNNDSVNNNAEVRLVTNHSNCRIVHHNQGGFYIIQSASGYLHYYQNGVSRVYIDPNGRVGVNYTGTAGWAEKLNVRGDYGTGQYAVAVQITGSSGSLMRFGTSSGVCGSISGSGTSTSFNTSSDYRLKENDVNITDGIARVKQLRPIRFNWKSDSSKTEDGFFAHEVSPVVPESVTGEKDAEIDEIGEGYQRMDHSKLVPLLTAALKEAISEIETLKTKVTALEGS